MTDKWVDSANKTVVSITAKDGLSLVGDVFLTDSGSHKWLIGIHGYTGKREHMHSGCGRCRTRTVIVS